MNEIIAGVAVAIIVGVGTLAWARWTVLFDRRVVYRWLRENTRDEPDESHVETADIAKCVGFSEERVRQACLADKRIYRAPTEADRWSVWRREPQSVYEKRGIIVLGKR